MRISQEVRETAANGLADMAETFRESGGELYQDADKLQALKDSNKAFNQD
jgi:hypothetical protein